MGGLAVVVERGGKGEVFAAALAVQSLWVGNKLGIMSRQVGVGGKPPSSLKHHDRPSSHRRLGESPPSSLFTNPARIDLPELSERCGSGSGRGGGGRLMERRRPRKRSEEHTSELQS